MKNDSNFVCCSRGCTHFAAHVWQFAGVGCPLSLCGFRDRTQFLRLSDKHLCQPNHPNGPGFLFYVDMQNHEPARVCGMKVGERLSMEQRRLNVRGGRRERFGHGKGINLMYNISV